MRGREEEAVNVKEDINCVHDALDDEWGSGSTYKSKSNHVGDPREHFNRIAKVLEYIQAWDPAVIKAAENFAERTIG